MSAELSQNMLEWIRVFANGWADVLWLPVALAIVHKGQRIKACAFIILCGVVMRLQIQIFEMMGVPKGVTGWFEWPLIYRGYAIYGAFILIFLLLSYFSPYTRGVIYFAACLSIFFMAFTVSSIVLIL